MSVSRTAVCEDRGDSGLAVLVKAGPAVFVADEPESIGGHDLGPNPHDLVAASLALCTDHTLRLYAQRKGWTLGAVKVEVEHYRDTAAEKPETFVRTLTLPPGLDEAQRTSMLSIAERCPIHRLLAPGANIRTILTPSLAA